MSKYTDLELTRMLSGNKRESESAFTEIYSRYSQKVYAYCLRVLGNAEDAKDVFQDVFLKFFSSAKAKGEISQIMYFIITIARNLCLNYRRDAKDIYHIEDYNIFSSQESTYEQKELMELVASSLNVLDITSREEFVLRIYHGYSYKEIAKITGNNEESIKTRVWRAKEKIKSILSPYLEDMSK